MWSLLPPPSSNRTCEFPASGFPGNLCWRHARSESLGLSAQSSSWRAARHWPTSRSKLHVERLTAYDNTNPAGPLRSTGITRRPHYYGPRRLPAGAAPTVMDSRQALDLRSTPPGLPGSWLVCRRPPSPLTPGSPSTARARCFVDGSRLRRFRAVGRSQITCNEAESGSLSLRLTSSPSEASWDRITPSHARLATWRTSTYHGQYLSTNEINQT